MRKLIKKRKTYHIKSVQNTQKVNDIAKDTQTTTYYNLPIQGQINPLRWIIFQYFTISFSIFLLFIFLQLFVLLIEGLTNWGYNELNQFIEDHWLKLLLVIMVLPIFILLFFSKPRGIKNKNIKNYLIKDEGIEFILLDNTRKFISFNQITYASIIPTGTGNYIFSIKYDCLDTGKQIEIYNLFEPDFSILRIYPLKNKQMMISIFLQQLRKKNSSAYINSLFSYILCIDSETLELDIKMLNREKIMNNIFWMVMIIVFLGFILFLYYSDHA